MLHRKLLLRRLAYVPWLLAVCLVLGWAGKAVAHDTGTGTDVSGHGGEEGDNHTHATDPYLDVTYALDTRPGTGLTPAEGTADTVFVSWNTSYSKNFGTDKSTAEPLGDGAEAADYTVTLHRDEIPSGTIDASSGGADAVSVTLTPADILQATRRATLVFDIDNAEAATNRYGFYWVKMLVDVPDADNTPASNNLPQFFVKQIAIEPDIILSVNPNSVREDAGATDIEIKAKVGNNTAMEQNTSVPLLMGTNQAGLNARFGIAFPPLVIPAGEKEATGMIRFTPIESTTAPHDDLLVTIRTVGGVAGVTDIRLVDTDKESTAISLSFSDATITKNDGATEIEVTATLDGKTLNDHVSFDLVIDNADANGTTIARRDVDYTATLRPITIRRRQVSGTATITINPLNEGVGLVRLKPANAVTRAGVTPALSIPVNPSSIDIADVPEAGVKGLTAMPFSIREDAEPKNIRLEFSLQSALLTDETVVFTISDDIERLRRQRDDIADRFSLAEAAQRDVDYRAQVQALIIPKGETTATTTMTVTPINNNREDGLRAFGVTATVGGRLLFMKAS